MSKGKIVQIIGPVVDVEFAGGVLPAIYNALTVSYEMPGSGTTKLTLEVQQHLGDNWGARRRHEHHRRAQARL